MTGKRKNKRRSNRLIDYLRTRRWRAAFSNRLPLAGHQSTQVLPSVVDFFKIFGSRGPQERFASSRLWMYRHAICEPLETRVLLASDFGDAPDTGAGTGAGNYQTLASDGGPQHTTVAGLFLGDIVDDDMGTLQNASANADDLYNPMPGEVLDDEDGLLTQLDLSGTVGSQPMVTLWVTNKTSSEATLSGWIDYNQNGVFDNTSERAQATVGLDTIHARVKLTFPTIPSELAGSTYARFRLSTDAEAQNPIGPASDGEVEDYVFTITDHGCGTAKTSSMIASGIGGGPVLSNGDSFGRSVALLGDLDGDGVADLAVGARGEWQGGSYRGAVFVLFMNTDGTAKSSTEIARDIGGGPKLGWHDRFGNSATSLGDLDGDGVPDLAVGAFTDLTGGTRRGAVYVLFMNTDGTAKSSTKIATGYGGGPMLSDFDSFGRSVASLGDLDGDGVADLAVGANGDDTGGRDRGAVHVLMMNIDGTVKSSTKIGGVPALSNGDSFGSSMESLGDLDGDGVADLAVGAYRDDSGGRDRGAVHVLLMNTDGTVKSSTKIASGIGGGPELSNRDMFGSSVTSPGDLDGDGVPDLAVGAFFDSTEGTRRGAVHVLLMNADGTAKSSTKIASSSSGPALSDFDYFGSSVASLGDLDGDGMADLAVGANGDGTCGQRRGAVHMLSMSPSAAPTLADADGTLSFTAGGAATVIDGSLTLADADDTHIESATISITSGFVSGEDVLSFVDSGSIIGSYNAGSGVLTLTGSASKASYESALESITYQNTSDYPSTGNRTVTWLVNDGDANSAAVTSTITVTGSLPGDFNGDQIVNDVDIDLLFAAVHSVSTDGQFDLDASGVIDASDVTLLVETILGTRFGDNDTDGDVDTRDLTTAIINFNSADGSGKSWIQGDTDGDGDVDTRDLTRSIINFTGALAVEVARAANSGVDSFDRSFGLVALKELNREIDESFSIAKTDTLQNFSPQEARTAEMFTRRTREIPRSFVSGSTSRSISKRSVDDIFAEKLD